MYKDKNTDSLPATNDTLIVAVHSFGSFVMVLLGNLESGAGVNLSEC